MRWSCLDKDRLFELVTPEELSPQQRTRLRGSFVIGFAYLPLPLFSIVDIIEVN